jgi:hypothetical protein
LVLRLKTPDSRFGVLGSHLLLVTRVRLRVRSVAQTAETCAPPMCQVEGSPPSTPTGRPRRGPALRELNGRIYETLAARLDRRPVCDLYQSAL